ncbi:MAG TPA: phosphatidylserine decarboxylase [Aquabacterium sp.]|nr:phosphatidylserine decarboxylase [Aquabacterium sp.]
MSGSISVDHRARRPVMGLIALGTVLWALWTGEGEAFLWGGLLALLVLVLWREPSRAVPAQAGAVLSPADGRIVRIERAHDPYANRAALRISVDMNLFDTHANRASVDGVIRQVQYHPGLPVSTDLVDDAPSQERNAIVIDACGQTVTLVQRAGLIARRILCHVQPGDILTRGQRFGLIRFGSRIDVYLPPHAVPHVAPGERVSATTTILATLASA